MQYIVLQDFNFTLNRSGGFFLYLKYVQDVNLVTLLGSLVNLMLIVMIMIYINFT